MYNVLSVLGNAIKNAAIGIASATVEAHYNDPVMGEHVGTTVINELEKLHVPTVIADAVGGAMPDVTISWTVEAIEGAASQFFHTEAFAAGGASAHDAFKAGAEWAAALAGKSIKDGIAASLPSPAQAIAVAAPVAQAVAVAADAPSVVGEVLGGLAHVAEGFVAGGPAGAAVAAVAEVASAVEEHVSAPAAPAVVNPVNVPGYPS